jgi:hypothetical protein
MSEFEQGQDTVGKVATFMVCARFLLESAKDWFLGVYSPGQHVSPRVQYGTACLLIRALGYVSCSRATGKGMAIPGIRLVQEGPKMGKP